MKPDVQSTAHHHTFAPTPVTRWFGATMALLYILLLFTPILLFYEAWAFRTLSYTIDANELHIKHGLRNITVPATAITAVTVAAAPPALRRIYGTSFAGFRVGWFRGPAGGRVYLVATAIKPLVFVETTLPGKGGRPGRDYGLTPADPTAFAAALRKVAGLVDSPPPDGDMGVGPEAEGASAQAGQVFAPAQSQKAGAVSPLLLFAIALSILMLAVMAALWAAGGPKHLSYEVSPAGITVRRRRFHRHLGWEQVVGVGRRDERLRGIRLMGIGLPGYFAGFFRFKDLGNVQVWATRLAPPIVIVTTTKRPWVLSPADADGFMAAVAAYL